MDKSQEGVPNKKTRKKFRINTCPLTSVLRVMALTSARPQFFRFYLWVHLKPLVYSAPIENEKTFNQRFVYACQNIRNRPGKYVLHSQQCKPPHYTLKLSVTSTMSHTGKHVCYSRINFHYFQLIHAIYSLLCTNY
jgi:hypothetical protein